MIVFMDCAEVRQPEEWFGNWALDNGKMYFKETKFLNAIKNQGSLIVLTNFNRVEGRVINTLIDFFCGRGQFRLAHGVKFWLFGVKDLDPSFKDKICRLYDWPLVDPYWLKTGRRNVVEYIED